VAKTLLCASYSPVRGHSATARTRSHLHAGGVDSSLGCSVAQQLEAPAAGYDLKGFEPLREDVDLRDTRIYLELFATCSKAR